MSEGISERQWCDAVGVLRVQQANVDLAYLRQWASVLELTELFEKALAEAAEQDNASITSIRFSSAGGKAVANQSIVSEFWEFLKIRKKFWLLPILIVLLLFGALIVFTESSAVAPFIYTLF